MILRIHVAGHGVMQRLLNIAWHDDELFAIQLDANIGQFCFVVDACCVQILWWVSILDVEVAN